MSNKKILVFDDDTERGRYYINGLKAIPNLSASYEIQSLTIKNFESQLEGLRNRRQMARKRKSWTDNIILDETSIFIIDFDLVNLEGDKAFITGEELAYLIRCFSECDVIVGITQYRDNIFDLTLQENTESYADLNIGGNDLANSGLWTNDWKEFRPWSWPSLPNFLESFHKRLEDVKDNLDQKIYEFLKIPAELIDRFPRSVSEFLGKIPNETTFRNFVKKSGNGLRGKDILEEEEFIARIAASRISIWLERLVLPGQEIIVDGPHLVSRFPSLFLEDHSDIDKWNKTANLDCGVESLGIDYKKIEEFTFKKTPWLSRPAWFWNKISNCEDIQEISEPWKTEWPNIVFCEDTSRFNNTDECKEFVADLDSQYVRRFIKEIDKIDYKPKVRFSV